MRIDTFISLSYLDWILSAEFLSKLFKLLRGESLHQSGYFDTMISSLSLTKDRHFSFFQRSCQLEVNSILCCLKIKSVLSILGYFPELLKSFWRQTSNNKKILLTTRNVRLDSGHYATKYYYSLFSGSDYILYILYAY